MKNRKEFDVLLQDLTPMVHALSRYSALFIFALLGACASNTSATSEFEPMKWKTFESRLLGKKVTFEFPVDIRGTSEFEFNPGMPPPMFQGDPRDNLRIIFSQSGLSIGLVNVKTKLNLSLSAQRNSADPSGLTGVPVQLGRHIWYRHSIQGLTGNRFDERYHTDLTREYSLFFSIRSSDTRGDEQTVAELKRIAQHILESIKIE